ncbi:ABC transporter ATP-binding protein [Halorussus litoreus]|uniref:ABC transporter ATP-binding protein n=1 Tax=Halorussus litoreus TaxID=1710536 RepID=UPI000E222C14|nr:ABC transporter ATP-binding protein [Halorussus litoreus]
MNLLETRNLSVEYGTDEGPLRAVDGVDLSVESGEILGVVGESGCGKTTLMKAILNLLPENGDVVEGDIQFDGRSLIDIPESELRPIRWEDLSYIIQNAMTTLDPVYRIGSQFVEIIRTHRDVSKSEARSMAGEMLEDVGIDRSRLSDYPHELSGGQRQRVVIALALVLDPKLVIADEPTTGLDVVTQEEILKLIKRIQKSFDSAVVLITHDISVVAEIADRVAVMYGGELVEVGPTSDVFHRSAHPYTMGLMNAFPSIEESADELVSIPGSPPNLVDPPTGCRFTERCPFATEECYEEPPEETVGERHRSRCHYTAQAPEFRERSERAETWTADESVRPEGVYNE